VAASGNLVELIALDRMVIKGNLGSRGFLFGSDQLMELDFFKIMELIRNDWEIHFLA